MMALVRTTAGPRVERRGERALGPGEVRLRVGVVGVCRTDVAAAYGRLAVAPGRVLGHEVEGAVEAVADDVSEEWNGRRVAVRPRLADGRFLGLGVDGAFAGSVVIPVANLVRLPGDLPPRRAAFVEPVAAALAVRRAAIPPGARVALEGRGRIAELTRRVLALDGLVPVEDEGPVAVLVHTSAGGIEGLERVGRGGLVVLKARPAGPVPVDLRRVVEQELRLVGVEYGDFDEAVRLLHSGALEVDDLLGEVLPLGEWARAFQADEGTKCFLDPAA